MVGTIKIVKLWQTFDSLEQAHETTRLGRGEDTVTQRTVLSAAKCRIVRVMCVGSVREMEGQLLVF